MAETNSTENNKDIDPGDAKYILAVDDEQSILDVIKHTLTPEGFRIATASDGETALQMIKEHLPDLVILDINMPGLSGIQVLKNIRQEADIPVIILSVLSDAGIISDALIKGADDYIRKPFDTGELVTRVKVQLNQHKPA